MPRISRRQCLVGVAIASATVLGSCALWFGKPISTIAPESLQKSDADMEALGFRVMRNAADSSQHASFNRIRRVYVKGSGPRVIVLHELPGLREGDIEVAQSLSEHFEVYVPLLFGTVGQNDSGLGTRQACRTHFFNCNDRNTRHSIMTDLLAMANEVCAKTECGAVGMCLTGTFPLWLMDAPGMVAAVLAQPTLPFVWHIWPFAGLDISEDDTAAAMAKAAERKASIYMVRYRGDWISGRTAFYRLADRIGRWKEKLSYFRVTEVEGRGHSTLVDDPKHPHVAPEQLQAIVNALKVRLGPTSTSHRLVQH